MSHEGVIARTIMLDRQLKSIIKKHPDTVIVNVGAGFDDRFSRMDNGNILWFDLDLPDSIAARRKAFPERDRVTMIAGNALEDSWCGQVKESLAGRKSKPVFIAEGLFMYLTLDQIRTFLEVLKSNFPGGGILIAEQNGKFMQKSEKHHDTVKNTNAHFMSGTDSGQEIADLTEGIEFVEEHSFNEDMKKYSIIVPIYNVEIELLKRAGKNVLFIANDGSSGCEYTFKTKKELLNYLKGYMEDIVEYEVDLDEIPEEE